VLARILAEADVRLGHRSGEVMALVVAGALSVPDGARLLCERMKAVGEADALPGAMLAANSQRPPRAGHVWRGERQVTSCWRSGLLNARGVARSPG
jgi:acyl transferase domain-containing protein